MFDNIIFNTNPDEEYLFLDTYSGRYFKSTLSELKNIFMAFANEKQYVNLNKIYKTIGLPTLRIGDVYGINFQLLDYEPDIASISVVRSEADNGFVFMLTMNVSLEKRDTRVIKLPSISEVGITLYRKLYSDLRKAIDNNLHSYGCISYYDLFEINEYFKAFIGELSEEEPKFTDSKKGYSSKKIWDMNHKFYNTRNGSYLVYWNPEEI